MKYFLKLPYEFVFRGKAISRIILIILSVFAFSLFTIGSMGYLYNEIDYMSRGYKNYLEEQEYLVFKDESIKTMDAEDIAFIENSLELPLLTFFSCQVTYQQYVGAFFESDSMWDTEDRTEKWHEMNPRNAGSQVFAASNQVYDAWGFDLLDGKYPNERNEIAVSKQLFELFQWGGYCYNFNSGRELLFYHENPSPKEEINEVSDLLGRKFFAVENGKPVEKEIVGIVDTHADIPETDQDGVPKDFREGAIFFSEAWKTTQLSRGDIKATHILVPVSPEVLKKSTLNQIAEITIKLVEKNIAQQKMRDTKYVDFNPPVGAWGMHDLMDNRADPLYSNFYTDRNLLAMIVGGVGLVFLIFSVTMNAHLVTAILENKQKQIGVLRALGASQRKVISIFLIGILYLALIIFLLSLAVSLSIYLFWLKPLLTFPQFQVCLLQFNGWTVLFLAVVSIGTPILSVILPLLRYFQKSTLENIKSI